MVATLHPPTLKLIVSHIESPPKLPSKHFSVNISLAYVSFGPSLNSLLTLIPFSLLYQPVAASVKMIQFSYSNKDIKDEEEEEGLVAAWAHRLGAAPRAEPATTLNTRCSTPSLHSGCSTWPYLDITWNRAITQPWRTAKSLHL
jgi:hypothetical protein